MRVQIGFLLALGLFVCALQAAFGLPIDLEYRTGGFGITTEVYTLDYDLASNTASVSPKVAKGTPVRAEMQIVLSSGGKTYRTGQAKAAGKLHPIRIGRYLTEVAVENIVLADETGNEWPGLAEVTFWCHKDRIYTRVSLILNDKEWVGNDMVVYRAVEGHRDCPSLDVADVGVHFTARDAEFERDSPCQSIIGNGAVHLIHQRQDVEEYREDASKKEAAAYWVSGEPAHWGRGSRHDMYFIVCPRRDRSEEARKIWIEESSPLDASSFEVGRGKFLGYDNTKGVYRFYALDADSVETRRNYYGGCTFTVSNGGDRVRTVLIDQFNDWGGIRGAVVRDGNGNPLPIHPQIAANFPEFHDTAGEKDWGYVTYPLVLKPNEKRAIRADHLYVGYGKHDQTLLMSLENIGDPCLLQTSVATNESHTMTTGLYFGIPTPNEVKHNELRINDLRRYKDGYGGYRSVAACLPTFFSYFDPTGVRHILAPKHVEIRHEGPNYVEYTVFGESDDGKVKARIDMMQTPHNDLTRVFSHVRLDFVKDVDLAGKRPSEVWFAHQYTFNPMVYTRYAFTAADGTVKTGELPTSGEAREDGTPLGDKPFICAYRADNPIDLGLPTSEIVGNPGFLLTSFRSSVNGQPIKPGLYVFDSKPLGAGGDYSRELAVTPQTKLARIKAGGWVEYDVMNFVYGEAKSAYEIPERERSAFATNPPKLTVTRGKKLADFPARLICEGSVAEFTISGGRNWLPVIVRGFGDAKPIKLFEKSSDEYRPLQQGVDGNDWYQCCPTGDGVGFIVLVNVGDGEPHSYKIVQ